MKFTISLVVFFLDIAFSQSNDQYVRSYGIKAGIVQASQRWEYSRNSFGYGITIFDKPRLGLTVGGFVEWFNISSISVITEMNYIQKGAQDKFEVTTVEFPDGTGEMKTLDPRIDYLSIPLLAKFRFETPSVTLYGIAGPRMDIIIGHNDAALGVVFSDLKSPEFGVTVGAGFDLPVMSTHTLGGEFRYSYSPQFAYSTQYLTVKNSSMEFLLTVGF